MVEIDAISRDILQAMSENCRISVSALAKELHCAPKTLRKKLAMLEKEYDLRYVLELDTHELGLEATYITVVKFSKQPDEKLLSAALAKYPNPQFAALVKGDFDMIIYSASANHLDFARWVNFFRQTLAGYIDQFENGAITGYWFGFFPTNEKTIRQATKLSEAEKVLLRLLLANARMPLKELARRAGLPVSTAQYNLKKILSSRMVIRPTVVIDKPPYSTIYIGLFSQTMTKRFLKVNDKVRDLLFEESKYSPMSRLISTFNTTAGSFDDVTIYAVDSPEEGYKFHDQIKQACGAELRESRLAYAIKILKGSLPCRKLEVKQAYRTLAVDIYSFMERE